MLSYITIYGQEVILLEQSEQQVTFKFQIVSKVSILKPKKTQQLEIHADKIHHKVTDDKDSYRALNVQ